LLGIVFLLSLSRTTVGSRRRDRVEGRRSGLIAWIRGLRAGEGETEPLLRGDDGRGSSYT